MLFKLPSYYKILHHPSFIFLMGAYHILLSIVAYFFAITHKADATHYWFITKTPDLFLEQSPLPLRENLLFYLNYFLSIQLKLPLWFGFMLYSVIGFIGIWYMYRIIIYLRSNTHWDYLYLFVLLLPSLHFWTGLLGKEPICILGIGLTLYSLLKDKNQVYYFITGILLLLIIRPHVALILGAAVFIAYFINTKKFNLRYLIAFIALLGIGIIFLLKSHWLQGISIENFQYLFQVHHEAFRETNSYVPLEDYNIFYKIFTFYFRPMPFEYNTLWGWFSGIENLLSLFVFIGGIYSICQLILRHKYKLGKLEISIIIFFLLLAGVLSLAYSNFGLISRMKNQSMPFMLMLCIYWISLYINQKTHGKT